MRKSILIFLLLVCSIGMSFGQMASKVDERIELTGVVFRLAGVPEYKEGLWNEYNEDIDRYFADYRYDPLIQYVITLRNEDHLGYGMIVGSSMFITIDKGKVVLNRALPLSKLGGLGTQWKDENTFRRYVKLLDDFYRKTKFREFYDAHRSLYKDAEAGLDAVFTDFNSDWFADFFGAEFKYPRVYVAMGNGRSNYCIVDYEHEAGYAIAIGGRLRYPVESILPTVIHEICHNYSGPLLNRYWAQMEPAARVVFAPDIRDFMREYGYGDAQTTTSEWLNNLCTIMYFRENLPWLATFFASEMRERGFIWMPRSIRFMDNFYRNRDKYPHVDSFMPQIADFLTYTAGDFDRVKSEFQHRRPYVTEVFPVNGSNIADGGVGEIKVTFSEPMSINVFSISVVEDDETIAEMPRSATSDVCWENDRTLVIPIDSSRLEKNKKYGLVLGARFMTDDYNKMGSEYTIIYNTSEK